MTHQRHHGAIPVKSLTTAMFLFFCVSTAAGQDWGLQGNPQLTAWFEDEVSRIEGSNDLSKYSTLEQWESARPELRRQLFEMLGLDPLPERTPLRSEVTGTVEEEEFVVENLHFQSAPGLFVTANLYRPKHQTGPLPAVLYVCGHGGVKKDGVSFGNKVHYHHHGSWFARNGYVCLTIDSLQLGEIEAIHHGTYRYDRWWWNARGYTPAGVEAWNCIRALDYLQERPEVDGTRMGVTGRSGGGAYSWWIAALDDRVQCAVPVAGIATVRDHVVDGCVEGHCDCMYLFNIYRWDYPVVAALVAPRSLLISNSDKDRIFPLDGVIEVHRQVAHIYDLYGRRDRLGLNITEGPHKDTQELRVHAFRWFNRWLQMDSDSLITDTASKFFEPQQLRVFQNLPNEERNTTIDQSFVPEADAATLTRRDAEQQRLRLAQKCFAAWPDMPPLKQDDASVTQQVSQKNPSLGTDSLTVSSTVIQFDSQPHVPLELTFHRGATQDDSAVTDVTLIVAAGEELDPTERQAMLDLLKQPGHAVAVFTPRGLGANKWAGNDKKQTQIRRRFQLIGTTLETMQAWDIRRAIQLCRSICGQDARTVVQAPPELLVETVSAVLYEPSVTRLAFPKDIDIDGEDVELFNLTRTVNIADLIRLVDSR